MNVGSTVVSLSSAQDLSGADRRVEGFDAVHQRFGPGRATGHVDVDRHHLINALNQRIVVKHAAGGRTHTHGDDPFGVHHLVIDLAKDRGHLLAHPTGNDHDVGLPGRRPEHLHAVSSQVVMAAACGHHLDGTAGEAEGGRPGGTGTCPLHQILQLSCQEVVFQSGNTVVAKRQFVAHAASRPSVPTLRTVVLVVRWAPTRMSE